MKRYILLIAVLVLSVSAWAKGKQEEEEEKKITSGGMLDLEVDLDFTDEQGRTYLHTAVIDGNKQNVVLLLIDGISIDAQDKQGKTALHYAITEKHFDIISILTESGADTRIEDKNGESPISLILQQDPNILPSIVDEDNVNLPLNGDNTLLHLAARDGMVDYVSKLLDIGADPSILNADGKTPLDLTLSQDMTVENAECATILLEADSPPPNDQEWTYITEPLRTGNLTMRFDYGSTVLHLAVEKNHKAMVSYLISRGDDINIQDEPGNTPLHIAIRMRNIDIAKFLLLNNADVNTQDYNGNTPMHESITVSGQDALLSMLIEKGADVNHKNNDGITPLHMAAIFSADIKQSQILIENGAKIDERDKNGNSVLLLALEANNRELAELLRWKGADIYATNNQENMPASIVLRKDRDTIDWFFNKQIINKRDNEGLSVLHHAILIPVSAESLKALFEKGADVNSRDLYGNTAMHLAVKGNKLELAKILLEENGDAFIDNESGESPLLLAFKEGSETTVELLNGNFEISDPWGNTPIFKAVKWDFPAITKALILGGGDVQQRNTQGATPLHESVRINSPESVSILVDNGAEINATDSIGRTPLHNAVTWDNLEIVRLLINYGVDTEIQDKSGQSALHLAALYGYNSILKELIKSNVFVNARDNIGRTALFLAAENDREESVRLLIAGDSVLDARDNKGRTALYAAIRNSSENAARALIESGSDMYALDSSGETPFDLLMNVERSVAEKLLSSSRIVNLRNNEGNTALHLAVLADADPRFVKLLLNKGADKRANNADRKTPYDLALARKNTELVELLRF